MNRNITALVLAACTLSPLASFAATHAEDNNANISMSKQPIVHVTLKNLSNLTQNLIIQGRPVSLAANEEYKVEAPAGTQVMGADNTVKLTLVKEYNNAVASFR